MNSIPRWLSMTIAVLLALLIIIVGTSQALLAWSRADLTSSTRSITITAEGKVSASPDTAEVDASIVSTGTNAQATQSDMDQKAAQLVAYLQKSGVAQSDISTSEYTLYPEYNNSSNSNTITGYSASETLSAKIHDLSKVSSLLGGVTQNGANQIESVNYTIDNSDNYREQARQQALSNAGQKAQDLANAAHVKLGKLITFSEDNNDSTPPVYPMAMADVAGGTNASSSATVPSGTQDITEDISVTYALK
jgi:uncharacterized protein YggE